MARFENEKLKIVFETIDPVTVGMRLRYLGILGIVGFGLTEENDQHYIRLWHAAKTIIKSLECEYMTLDVDIDKTNDPRVARAIMWIGYTASEVIYKMDEMPKN